jgi:Tetracyclin repressor-like, C-terminal domain
VTHKEVHRTAIELILRDGIEAGEFEQVDPRETSALIMRTYVAFCHPILIAQGLQEGQDLESEAHALIRFVLRAITPRK